MRKFKLGQADKLYEECLRLDEEKDMPGYLFPLLYPLQWFSSIYHLTETALET